MSCDVQEFDVDIIILFLYDTLQLQLLKYVIFITQLMHSYTFFE